MKRLSARSWSLLIVCLAAAAGEARADYMNWSYSSDPNVPGVTAGATGANGGGNVSLTDYTNQPGGKSIPVIAYLTSSSVTTPINFNPTGTPPTTYNLALTLTDNATHDSRTLNFSGAIAGTLSATTSTLVNTFARESETVTFDKHTYTVRIPSVTLAAPTSPQQNIYATVSVGTSAGTPQGPSGPPSTPEPSSLLLATLGLSFAGLGRWRRRRLP